MSGDDERDVPLPLALKRLEPEPEHEHEIPFDADLEPGASELRRQPARLPLPLPRDAEEQGSGTDGDGGETRASRLFARLTGLFAALCVLLFTATLADVARVTGLAAAALGQAKLADGAPRDAAVIARVSAPDGAPIAGATVRVFSVQGELAYFAGEALTEAEGRARMSALPRGLTWVLAYAPGRARASASLRLVRSEAEGAGEVALVLAAAAVLDVAVVDDDDAAVASAEVRVVAGDALPFVAKVNRDGKARFDRLGPGPYTVTARAAGFDDATRTVGAAGAEPLRIRLGRKGSLEVLVTRADGSPAGGAEVLAAGPSLWPARGTATDAAGRAHIVGLGAGVYDLRAKLGGEVSRTEFAVPLAAGESKTLRLMLLPGRSVTVRVGDGESSPGRSAPPVPDASVVLAPEGLSAFPLVGKTGPTGEVVLGPFLEDLAVVAARADGFVARSGVPVLPDASVVEVGLLRGAALVGDVVDERDFPVAGATLEVVGTDTTGMPIAETTGVMAIREGQFEATLAGPRPLIPVGELGVMPGPLPDLPREGATSAVGVNAQSTPLPSFGALESGLEPWVSRADGTFRVSPVPPGRVQIIVRHPDFVETVSEAVTLAPGGEAKLRIVLRKGGMLLGRVVERSGQPAPGARIELRSATGAEARVGYAEADGTFTFAAVPDEVTLAVARADAPQDVVTRVKASVPGGERVEIEIELPEAREPVLVRVRDDRGYAVGAAEVHVASLDEDAPVVRTLFTNDDGEATCLGARGLPLEVRAGAVGQAPGVVLVSDAPAVLEIVLKRGVRVTGSVTGRDGRDRVGGAEVRVHTRTGVRVAYSDDAGEFAFDDMAPGAARFEAVHPEWPAGEITVVVPDDPQRGHDVGAIDLAASGEVEGTVVDDAGKPVAGARVAAGFVPTYLPLGPLPPGIVTTDAEGRFVLPRVPDGDQDIEAFSAERGKGSASAVVTADRVTSRVEIALDGGARAPDAKGSGSVAVTLGERAGRVLVLSVPPGSEAEVAGIFPGDVLESVSGDAVATLEQARKRLTGPLGEDVVVGLVRELADREVFRVRVKRERVRR